MNLIIKIMGVALCGAMLNPLIKRNNPELSYALMLAVSAVIIYMLSDTLSLALSEIKSIFGAVPGAEDYLGRILKVTGIALISEYGAALVTDGGETALGRKIELAGKLIILTVALPVIKSLYQSISGLI